MGGTVTLTVAKFRIVCPEFADAGKYPDALLSLQLEFAQEYVSPVNGCNLSGSSRALAIYYMAAVLVKASALSPEGESLAAQDGAGITTSASIDRVSVSKALPDFGKSAFKYFLLKYPPYGEQLLALLNAKKAAGIFVNGSFENVLR